jgi:hypothetical protein
MYGKYRPRWFRADRHMPKIQYYHDPTIPGGDPAEIESETTHPGNAG